VTARAWDFRGWKDISVALARASGASKLHERTAQIYERDSGVRLRRFRRQPVATEGELAGLLERLCRVGDREPPRRDRQNARSDRKSSRQR